MRHVPQLRLKLTKNFDPPVRAPYEQQSRKDIVGVDLGQANDRAAAFHLGRNKYVPPFIGPRDERWVCGVIRRWERNTDYTEVVEDLLRFPAEKPILCVEYNGVGRPVIDLLRRRAREVGFQGRIIPITTAQSNSKIHAVNTSLGTSISVPKVELVTSIELLRQQKMLVLPNIPEVALLIKEMGVFQSHIRQTQRSVSLTFGASGSNHDDLVIAAGIACWYAINFGHREIAVSC